MGVSAIYYIISNKLVRKYGSLGLEQTAHVDQDLLSTYVYTAISRSFYDNVKLNDLLSVFLKRDPDRADKLNL